MNDYLTQPSGLEKIAAALARGLSTGVNKIMLNEMKSGAGTVAVEGASESALCKETLQALRELASDMEASFFPQLLETFKNDAVEHIAVLRSAIAGDEPERLCREAHALKGASLTIGAKGMADICQQLENIPAAKNMKVAWQDLARLDHEFDRVKNEIEQESLIP